MELFLFAVGNFLWKSILLTQHNEADYSCLESAARKKKERNAVIKNTFMSELQPGLDSMSGDPLGWTTKEMTRAGLSSTPTKSSNQIWAFLIPNTEWREKSSWGTS